MSREYHLFDLSIYLKNVNVQYIFFHIQLHLVVNNDFKWHLAIKCSGLYLQLVYVNGCTSVGA